MRWKVVKFFQEIELRACRALAEYGLVSSQRQDFSVHHFSFYLNSRLPALLNISGAQSWTCPLAESILRSLLQRNRLKQSNSGLIIDSSFIYSPQGRREEQSSMLPSNQQCLSYEALRV